MAESDGSGSPNTDRDRRYHMPRNSGYQYYPRYYPAWHTDTYRGGYPEDMAQQSNVYDNMEGGGRSFKGAYANYLYDNTPYIGESYNSSKSSGKYRMRAPSEITGSSSDEYTQHAARRRCAVVLAVVGMVFLCAIGLGVGIYFGVIDKKESYSEVTTTTPSPVVADTLESTLTIDRAFTPNLNDPSSSEYQTLAADVVDLMNATMARSELADQYIGSRVTGFKQGSIIAIVKSEFRQAVAVATFIQNLKQYIGNVGLAANINKEIIIVVKITVGLRGLDLGETCTTETECEDSDTICVAVSDEENSKTCQCNSTHYSNNPNGNGGLCLPKIQINKTCDATYQCLPAASQCLNTKCICTEDDYYSNNECKPKPTLGENCSGEDECLEPTVCASSTNTCSCPSTMYEDNGSCVQKKDLEEDCLRFDECITQGADCIGFKCNCPQSKYYDNVACVNKKALGSNCTIKGECSDPHAVCTNNKCACPSDMYNKSNVCEEKLDIGSDCTSEDVCKDSSAECKNSKCTCPTGMFNNNNVCDNKVALGEFCPTSDACNDSSAECNTNNICSCPAPLANVNSACVETTTTSTTSTSTAAPTTASTPTAAPTTESTTTAAPTTASTTTAAPTTASTTTAAPTTASTTTAAPTTASTTAAPTTASTTTAAPTTDSTTTGAPTTDSTTTGAPPTDSTTMAAPPTDSTTTAAPPTDSTTAAPPTDSTTAAPPTDSTTAAPPTDSTTAAPPTDSTTAAPPTDSTTAAPPTDSTTAAPPTDSTTAAPPTDSTTAAPPTDSTTAAPPTDSTTAAPPTDSTTAAPPTDSTTAAPPTDSTTAAPPTDSTTAAPPTDSTTAAPPTDSTTAAPPTDSTTAAPPTDSTTAAPPTDSTTAAPPTDSTTAAPPTDSTTAAPPTDSTTAAPPTDSTTAAPPTDSTTAAPPTDSTTAAPPTDSTTAAPPTDSTTAAPPTDSTTAAPPTDSTTAAPPTDSTTAAPPTVTSPLSTTTSSQPTTTPVPTTTSTTTIPTTTVPDEPVEIVLNGSLTSNLTFTEDLNNKSSPSFQEAQDVVCGSIVDGMNETTECELTDIQPGSVVYLYVVRVIYIETTYIAQSVEEDETRIQVLTQSVTSILSLAIETAASDQTAPSIFRTGQDVKVEKSEDPPCKNVARVRQYVSVSTCSYMKDVLIAESADKDRICLFFNMLLFCVSAQYHRDSLQCDFNSEVRPVLEKRAGVLQASMILIKSMNCMPGNYFSYETMDEETFDNPCENTDEIYMVASTRCSQEYTAVMTSNDSCASITSLSQCVNDQLMVIYTNNECGENSDGMRNRQLTKMIRKQTKFFRRASIELGSCPFCLSPNIKYVLKTFCYDPLVMASEKGMEAHSCRLLHLAMDCVLYHTSQWEQTCGIDKVKQMIKDEAATFLEEYEGLYSALASQDDPDGISNCLDRTMPTIGLQPAPSDCQNHGLFAHILIFKCSSWMKNTTTGTCREQYHRAQCVKEVLESMENPVYCSYDNIIEALANDSSSDSYTSIQSVATELGILSADAISSCAGTYMYMSAMDPCKAAYERMSFTIKDRCTQEAAESTALAVFQTDLKCGLFGLTTNCASQIITEYTWNMCNPSEYVEEDFFAYTDVNSSCEITMDDTVDPVCSYPAAVAVWMCGGILIDNTLTETDCGFKKFMQCVDQLAECVKYGVVQDLSSVRSFIGAAHPDTSLVCLFEKEGTCPDTARDTVGICLHECYTDNECDGEKKCCFNGCGFICMAPAGPTIEWRVTVAITTAFWTDDFDDFYSYASDQLKMFLFESNVFEHFGVYATVIGIRKVVYAEFAVAALVIKFESAEANPEVLTQSLTEMLDSNTFWVLDLREADVCPDIPVLVEMINGSCHWLLQGLRDEHLGFHTICWYQSELKYCVEQNAFCNASSISLEELDTLTNELDIPAFFTVDECKEDPCYSDIILNKVYGECVDESQSHSDLQGHSETCGEGDFIWSAQQCRDAFRLVDCVSTKLRKKYHARCWLDMESRVFPLMHSEVDTAVVNRTIECCKEFRPVCSPEYVLKQLHTYRGGCFHCTNYLYSYDPSGTCSNIDDFFTCMTIVAAANMEICPPSTMLSFFLDDPFNLDYYFDFKNCLLNPVCLHYFDPGYCNGESFSDVPTGVYMYYYDKYSGMCQEMHYSGCGGNENRFIDMESCEETCIGTVMGCPNSLVLKGSDREQISCDELSPCPEGSYCHYGFCCADDETSALYWKFSTTDVQIDYDVCHDEGVQQFVDEKCINHYYDELKSIIPVYLDLSPEEIKCRFDLTELGSIADEIDSIAPCEVDWILDSSAVDQNCKAWYSGKDLWPKYVIANTRSFYSGGCLNPLVDRLNHTQNFDMCLFLQLGVQCIRLDFQKENGSEDSPYQEIKEDLLDLMHIYLIGRTVLSVASEDSEDFMSLMTTKLNNAVSQIENLRSCPGDLPNDACSMPDILANVTEHCVEHFPYWNDITPFEACRYYKDYDSCTRVTISKYVGECEKEQIDNAMQDHDVLIKKRISRYDRQLCQDACVIDSFSGELARRLDDCVHSVPIYMSIGSPFLPICMGYVTMYRCAKTAYEELSPDCVDNVPRAVSARLYEDAVKILECSNCDVSDISTCPDTSEVAYSGFIYCSYMFYESLCGHTAEIRRCFMDNLEHNIAFRDCEEPLTESAVQEAVLYAAENFAKLDMCPSFGECPDLPSEYSEYLMECSFETDCDLGYRCCEGVCELAEVVGNPGKCPQPGSELFDNEGESCIDDTFCNYTHKCCSDGTQMRCTVPEPIYEADGICPAPGPFTCDSYGSECTVDDHCYNSGQKCCDACGQPSCMYPVYYPCSNEDYISLAWETCKQRIPEDFAVVYDTYFEMDKSSCRQILEVLDCVAEELEKETKMLCHDYDFEDKVMQLFSTEYEMNYWYGVPSECKVYKSECTRQLIIDHKEECRYLAQRLCSDPCMSYLVFLQCILDKQKTPVDPECTMQKLNDFIIGSTNHLNVNFVFGEFPPCIPDNEFDQEGCADLVQSRAVKPCFYLQGGMDDTYSEDKCSPYEHVLQCIGRFGVIYKMPECTPSVIDGNVRQQHSVYRNFPGNVSLSEFIDQECSEGLAELSIGELHCPAFDIVFKTANNTCGGLGHLKDASPVEGCFGARKWLGCAADALQHIGYQCNYENLTMEDLTDMNDYVPNLPSCLENTRCYAALSNSVGCLELLYHAYGSYESHIPPSCSWFGYAQNCVNINLWSEGCMESPTPVDDYISNTWKDETLSDQCADQEYGSVCDNEEDAYLIGNFFCGNFETLYFDATERDCWNMVEASHCFEDALASVEAYCSDDVIQNAVKKYPRHICDEQSKCKDINEVLFYLNDCHYDAMQLWYAEDDNARCRHLEYLEECLANTVVENDCDYHEIKMLVQRNLQVLLDYIFDMFGVPGEGNRLINFSLDVCEEDACSSYSKILTHLEVCRSSMSIQEDDMNGNKVCSSDRVTEGQCRTFMGMVSCVTDKLRQEKGDDCYHHITAEIVYGLILEKGMNEFQFPNEYDNSLVSCCIEYQPTCSSAYLMMTMDYSCPSCKHMANRLWEAPDNIHQTCSMLGNFVTCMRVKAAGRREKCTTKMLLTLILHDPYHWHLMPYGFHPNSCLEMRDLRCSDHPYVEYCENTYMDTNFFYNTESGVCEEHYDVCSGFETYDDCMQHCGHVTIDDLTHQFDQALPEDGECGLVPYNLVWDNCLSFGEYEEDVDDALMKYGESAWCNVNFARHGSAVQILSGMGYGCNTYGAINWFHDRTASMCTVDESCSTAVMEHGRDISELCLNCIHTMTELLEQDENAILHEPFCRNIFSTEACALVVLNGTNSADACSDGIELETLLEMLRFRFLIESVTTKRGEPYFSAMEMQIDSLPVWSCNTVHNPYVNELDGICQEELLAEVTSCHCSKSIQLHEFRQHYGDIRLTSNMLKAQACNYAYQFVTCGQASASALMCFDVDMWGLYYNTSQIVSTFVPELDLELCSDECVQDHDYYHDCLGPLYIGRRLQAVFNVHYCSVRKASQQCIIHNMKLKHGDRCDSEEKADYILDKLLMYSMDLQGCDECVAEDWTMNCESIDDLSMFSYLYCYHTCLYSDEYSMCVNNVTTGMCPGQDVPLTENIVNNIKESGLDISSACSVEMCSRLGTEEPCDTEFASCYSDYECGDNGHCCGTSPCGMQCVGPCYDPEAVRAANNSCQASIDRSLFVTDDEDSGYMEWNEPRCRTLWNYLDCFESQLGSRCNSYYLERRATSMLIEDILHDSYIPPECYSYQPVCTARFIRDNWHSCNTNMRCLTDVESCQPYYSLIGCIHNIAVAHGEDDCTREKIDWLIMNDSVNNLGVSLGDVVINRCYPDWDNIIFDERICQKDELYAIARNHCPLPEDDSCSEILKFTGCMASILNKYDYPCPLEVTFNRTLSLNGLELETPEVSQCREKLLTSSQCQLDWLLDIGKRAQCFLLMEAVTNSFDSFGEITDQSCSLLAEGLSCFKENGEFDSCTLQELGQEWGITADMLDICANVLSSYTTSFHQCPPFEIFMAVSKYDCTAEISAMQADDSDRYCRTAEEALFCGLSKIQGIGYSCGYDDMFGVVMPYANYIEADLQLPRNFTVCFSPCIPALYRTEECILILKDVPWPAVECSWHPYAENAVDQALMAVDSSCSSVLDEFDWISTVWNYHPGVEPCSSRPEPVDVCADTELLDSVIQSYCSMKWDLNGDSCSRVKNWKECSQKLSDICFFGKCWEQIYQIVHDRTEGEEAACTEEKCSNFGFLQQFSHCNIYDLPLNLETASHMWNDVASCYWTESRKHGYRCRLDTVEHALRDNRYSVMPLFYGDLDEIVHKVPASATARFILYSAHHECSDSYSMLGRSSMKGGARAYSNFLGCTLTQISLASADDTAMESPTAAIDLDNIIQSDPWSLDFVSTELPESMCSQGIYNLDDNTSVTIETFNRSVKFTVKVLSTTSDSDPWIAIVFPDSENTGNLDVILGAPNDDGFGITNGYLTPDFELVEEETSVVTDMVGKHCRDYFIFSVTRQNKDDAGFEGSVSFATGYGDTFITLDTNLTPINHNAGDCLPNRETQLSEIDKHIPKYATRCNSEGVFQYVWTYLCSPIDLRASDLDSQCLAVDYTLECTVRRFNEILSCQQEQEPLSVERAKEWRDTSQICTDDLRTVDQSKCQRSYTERERFVINMVESLIVSCYQPWINLNHLQQFDIPVSNLSSATGQDSLKCSLFVMSAACLQNQLLSFGAIEWWDMPNMEAQNIFTEMLNIFLKYGEDERFAGLQPLDTSDCPDLVTAFQGLDPLAGCSNEIVVDYIIATCAGTFFSHADNQITPDPYSCGAFDGFRGCGNAVVEGFGYYCSMVPSIDDLLMNYQYQGHITEILPLNVDMCQGCRLTILGLHETEPICFYAALSTYQNFPEVPALMREPEEDVCALRSYGMDCLSEKIDESCVDMLEDYMQYIADQSGQPSGRECPGHTEMNVCKNLKLFGLAICRQYLDMGHCPFRQCFYKTSMEKECGFSLEETQWTAERAFDDYVRFSVGGRSLPECEDGCYLDDGTHYYSGEEYRSGCQHCNCRLGMWMCEDLCAAGRQCYHKPDTGPCRAKMTRWFYSEESAWCEEFTYGGCKGNGNNFLTQEDCVNQCVMNPVPVCKYGDPLPEDEGSCGMIPDSPVCPDDYFCHVHPSDMFTVCCKETYNCEDKHLIQEIVNHMYLNETEEISCPWYLNIAYRLPGMYPDDTFEDLNQCLIDKLLETEKFDENTLTGLSECEPATAAGEVKLEGEEFVEPLWDVGSQEYLRLERRILMELEEMLHEHFDTFLKLWITGFRPSPEGFVLTSFELQMAGRQIHGRELAEVLNQHPVFSSAILFDEEMDCASMDAIQELVNDSSVTWDTYSTIKCEWYLSAMAKLTHIHPEYSRDDLAVCLFVKILALEIFMPDDVYSLAECRPSTVLVEISINGVEFVVAFEDLRSEASVNLLKDIVPMLKELMYQHFGENFIRLSVKRLRPGSTIGDVVIEINQDPPQLEEIREAINSNASFTVLSVTDITIRPPDGHGSTERPYTDRYSTGFVTGRFTTTQRPWDRTEDPDRSRTTEGPTGGVTDGTEGRETTEEQP